MPKNARCRWPFRHAKLRARASHKPPQPAGYDRAMIADWLAQVVLELRHHRAAATDAPRETIDRLIEELQPIWDRRGPTLLMPVAILDWSDGASPDETERAARLLQQNVAAACQEYLGHLGALDGLFRVALTLQPDQQALLFPARDVLAQSALEDT